MGRVLSGARRVCLEGLGGRAAAFLGLIVVGNRLGKWVLRSMFNEIKKYPHVDFTSSIQFRITDHNYGDHVANNVFVEYLHEGRVQFLAQFGYTEKNVEGVALIMSELCIKYTRQAFYPDILRLEIALANPRPTRFYLFYRGFNKAGELLLLAKTEMAAFDASSGRPIRMPEAFFAPFER